MKRLRIISLACALCLFLSACASQQPEDSNSTEPSNTVRITIQRDPALLISAA